MLLRFVQYKSAVILYVRNCAYIEMCEQIKDVQKYKFFKSSVL
jgi:hypothetical protein